MQGEYNIAFLIEEWRYGVRIGYVTRDMQIAITACSNQPPIISPLQDDCVVVGETLSFTVSATDPDNDWLSLHALGGPLILPEILHLSLQHREKEVYNLPLHGLQHVHMFNYNPIK